MPTFIPDLWPATFGSVTLSPVAILREQAEWLSRKTAGAITGFVRTVSRVDGGFSHTLILRVPQLGNYLLELFTIQHKIPFYPVQILASCLPNGEQEVLSEKEYLETLQLVLTHPSTVEIINALLSQVQPVANPS